MRIVFETLWARPDDGWSISSRAYARTLALAGHDVRLLSNQRAQPGVLDPEVAAEIPREMRLPVTKYYEYDAYVFSTPLGGPRAMAAAGTFDVSVPTPHLFYTMFERLNVQPEIARALNGLDGTWVPCSQNRDALRAAGVDSVTWIPFPHFPDDPYLALPPPRSEPTTFLWVGRWERRKAPHNVVRAFLRAFAPGEAKLILKTNGRHANDPNYLNVQRTVSANLGGRWTRAAFEADVRVVDGFLTRRQMAGLMAEADVYVSASRGEGLCAIKGTIVDTATGPVPIEQIKKGTLVFTHRGRLRAVTSTTNRWHHRAQGPGELIDIKPHGLSKMLSFTPEHPHYIVRRHAAKSTKDIDLVPIFLEARRIEPGDLWVVPKLQPLRPVTDLNISDFVDVRVVEDKILCKHSFPKREQLSILKVAKATNCSFQFVSKILRGQQRGLRKKGRAVLEYARCTGTTARVPLQLPNTLLLTPEFMFFLGHYIAEGSATDSTVVLSTHLEERWGRSLSAQAIRQTFGLEATEHHVKEKVVQLRFGNVVVAQMLKVLCGNGARSKHIADVLKASPNIHHLIRGLFYGDGCFAARKFAFSTASAKLASDIVEILNRCGIFARYSRPKRKKDCFYLTVVNQHAERFCTLVKPFKYNKRLVASTFGGRMFLREDAENFYLPIQRVERRWHKGMVYNVSVDEDASYTCHGFATHNCLSSYAAKLAGRTVVTTDSGGPRDFVGEGDHLVPAKGTYALPEYAWLWDPGATVIDYDLGDLVTAMQRARGRAPQRSDMSKFEAKNVARVLREWLGQWEK